MDKSGRKALAANLRAITESSDSRRGWTSARRIDTKTAERAEKDEGEKGVSLQAVDDIAHGLGLAAWQLLVPGLDVKNPPRLITEPVQAPDTRQALQIVRARLAEACGDDSRRAAEALQLLAMTPDSERAFSNALAALDPTGGKESPPDSGAESPQAHLASHDSAETGLAAPQTLGVAHNTEGKKWHMKRERTISNSPRTDTSRERQPGENVRPASRKGKEQ